MKDATLWKILGIIIGLIAMFVIVIRINDNTSKELKTHSKPDSVFVQATDSHGKPLVDYTDSMKNKGICSIPFDSLAKLVMREQYLMQQIQENKELSFDIVHISNNNLVLETTECDGCVSRFGRVIEHEVQNIELSAAEKDSLFSSIKFIFRNRLKALYTEKAQLDSLFNNH